MSYNYIGTTKWVKQPNRLVKTFPSGLCLIQQDYIIQKHLAEYSSFAEGQALSDADSQPCIDGAYIFPKPDYQDMGNGFIKCTVTAYGRVSNTGTVSLRKVPTFVTLTLAERRKGIAFENGIFDCKDIIMSNHGGNLPFYVKYPYGGGQDCLMDYPTLSIVLPSNESPSTIPPTNLVNLYVAKTGENITNKTFTPLFFGFTEDNSFGNFTAQKLSVDLLYRIDRIETTNYGRFQEYSISWSHAGNPSIFFGEFVKKGSWSPFYEPAIITSSNITSTGFMFSAGASYSVLGVNYCVDPLLQVTQTEVTVKQGLSVITAFNVPLPKVGPIQLTSLTPDTQYEIEAVVTNPFVSVQRQLSVTTDE